MKYLLTLATCLFAGTAVAWLPAVPKIRGVNIGGLFVAEPWMMNDEWNRMGCDGALSEFDCVIKLGQDAADRAFQDHWANWYTQDDIRRIASLGLNTIRIPVGYWMREDIVWRDSEHFPRGAFRYLKRMCQWAKDAGLYVIIDLHGAPGAQQPNQPFTGQFAPTVGFYVSWQYERAYQFLEWMTRIIHTDSAFWSVGAIQLVNEPFQNPSQIPTLVSEFYPNAWRRIRAAEDQLGTARDQRLHIQMMNEKWGSGNPNQALTDLWFAFYDDHKYVKWTPDVDANRDAYMRYSCTDDRGGNWPVIVGEWSLSTADENGSEFDINRADAKDWYRRWWSAQTISYEKQNGWVFWSWKVDWIGGRNDWRWGYRNAVDAGVIPADAAAGVSSGACDGFV